MIINTSTLESKLGQPNLLVIDTRSFKEYSEGHIPGSVNLDLFAFHWIDTTKQGIENFNKQTEMIFSFVGINSQKKVVFYDNVSGMLAARGVWMLEYFSHHDVSLLDGGMTKWRKENRQVETKSNPFQPSQFSGKINPEIISSFEFILNNKENLEIIDARSEEEYNGKMIRAAQSGHIPESININWNLNLNKDGTFKSDDELSKLYKLPKDSMIVTYCQGAYRAANTFLALKKLGFKNVRVYLGSWGEWGNKLELPVEK